MPKPPTSTRTVRLTDDDWAWLKAEAERCDVSVNSLVVLGVRAIRGAQGQQEVDRWGRPKKSAVEPTAPVTKRDSDEPLRMPRAPIGSLAKKPKGK